MIVHREPVKPNLHFKCHPNGLHCIQPDLLEFSLVETVAGNKEGYSKQQLHDAKKASDLLAKVRYQ